MRRKCALTYNKKNANEIRQKKDEIQDGKTQDCLDGNMQTRRYRRKNVKQKKSYEKTGSSNVTKVAQMFLFLKAMFMAMFWSSEIHKMLTVPKYRHFSHSMDILPSTFCRKWSMRQRRILSTFCELRTTRTGL